MGKLPIPGPSLEQGSLAVTIIKEIEVEGVGMGVLSDGTPYLTERGLARLCGVGRQILSRLSSEWIEEVPRPRVQKIKQSLFDQGIILDKPFIPISVMGSTHHAYPESICMAVLEYYAFDANQTSNDIAAKNYRLLARRSFREFIYTQTGYSPDNAIPAVWQQFHDRVSLAFNEVPAGYFSVFKELSDMIVTLIHSGANIGSDFIPDISVGLTWAAYWKKEGLSEKYGSRKEYIHSYPSYFPQSASNPQKPYCYPDESLPVFRRWMREVYLPTKFPAYLNKKVRERILPASFAEISLQALQTGTDPRRLAKK